MITTPQARARPLDRLTGWQGSSEYFRFLEPDRFDPGLVVEVLRGKVAGVMFRDVIDPAAAGELVRRFWESPARKRRGGEVCESQGYYVGAYHYHKPTLQYLEESTEVAGYLASLLDIRNEPSRWFRQALTARLAEEGVSFRLSAKDGLEGCQARQSAQTRRSVSPIRRQHASRQVGQQARDRGRCPSRRDGGNALGRGGRG